MKTLYSLLMIVGVTVLTIANPGFARFDSWNSENGVMIRQGHHVFWTGTAMATDGNDNWVIAWSDAHNGTMDVYAQLYDAEGNELWQSGGLRVTEGEYPEEMPMVVYAGNDEWIIGWHDYRLDVDYLGYNVVCAQKYNAQGEALWTDGGVLIGPEGGNRYEGKSQTHAVMHATADGGAICVYEGGRNTRESRFFAQRLSSDGDLLWADQGVIISDEHAKIASTSDKNNGLTYILRRLDHGNMSSLTIHHLDSNGEQTWGENGSGLVLDNPDENSHGAEIASDGNDGVFACWVHNNPQSLPSLYGQHISGEGEFYWGEYGTELTLRFENGINYELINSSPLEMEIVWNNYNTPIFAQRIESVDHHPVLHWGEDGQELRGIQVSEKQNSLTVMSIFPDGHGGLVTTWVERNEAKYRDFKVQRIAVDGTMPWNEPGTIRVRDLDCSSQKIVALGDRLFFAWRETRTPEFGLNYQAYDMDNGSTLFEEYSIPIVTGITNFTSFPKIVRSGESAYVSWVDARYDPFGKMPYMQRVDIETGQPQWDYQGINLTPRYLEENDSSNTAIYGAVEIVPDGSGGAYAMWGKQAICVQKVNEDGTLPLGDNGVRVFGQDGLNLNSSTDRKLYSDDEGGVVIIADFENYGSRESQIRIQRLDSNGQKLLGEAGVEVKNNGGARYRFFMKSIKLSDNNFLVLWNNQNNLEAIKLNRDGEFIWESPVVLKEFGDHASGYKVVEIENTIVVSYDDQEGEALQTFMIYLNQDGVKMHDQYDLALDHFGSDNQMIDFYSDNKKGWITYLRDNELYLSSLEVDGEGPRLDADRTQLVTICESTSASTNIVEDGNGGVFVFWIDETRDYDILYKHFDKNVQPVCAEYEDESAVLVDARYHQFQMCMVPDGEGGILTAWNDWRSSTGYQEGDDVYIMRINDGHSMSVKNSPPVAGLPGLWSLAAAYPNPFNSTTRISFTTPVRAELKVTVFDALGRQVASLANGIHAAGEHTLTWNSKDSFGQPVVSGMYFYEIRGEGVQMTNKVFLVR